MAALDGADRAPAAARGVAIAFLGAAAACAGAGMAWGIVMAATGDHALSPAHGHLNLLGWATLALCGLYYAITPAAAASRLARVHLGLALAGVLLLAPGIALAISGGPEGVAILGSLASLAAMGTFGAVLLRHGVGPA